MAITVDWSTAPWLITIPQADLTLVEGTKYSITVDHLWSLLRDFSDGPEGSAQPITYRRTAATASTPAITEVNDPYYEAQFENGAYSVDIINGNTNFRDVEVKNTVSVATNNTTGFIEPTFLEAGLFNEVVTVDIANGVAGTTKTSSGAIIGTRQAPSNNFADALTIAANRGLDTFAIIGDATIDSGLNYTDFVFLGQGRNLSTLTVTAAAVVNNCSFLTSQVTGTLDGDSRLEDSIIENLSFISGVIENCLLNPGTIILGGSATAHFINCASGIPGVSTPVINCGGSGQALALRNYNGGVKLTNKTGSDAVTIDLNAGQVILDSATVTGTGDIVVRGVGKLVDENGTPIISGTWNGTVPITNELVEGPQTQALYAAEINTENNLSRSEILRIIIAALAGKLTKSGNNFTFRDLADSKNRITGTTDGAGSRTSVTVDGS